MFLTKLIDWFLPSLPSRIPSPIVAREKDYMPPADVKPDNVLENQSWGTRIVDAIVTTDQARNSFEWEPYNEGGELSPIPLSRFDEDLIRENNLNREIYRKAKPYVLAPTKYTNEEIGAFIGVSKSSIDKVSARIREAWKTEKTPSPVD